MSWMASVLTGTARATSLPWFHAETRSRRGLSAKRPEKDAARVSWRATRAYSGSLRLLPALQRTEHASSASPRETGAAPQAPNPNPSRSAAL